MVNLTKPHQYSNTRREDLGGRTIKYYRSLSRLLTWRLRFPMDDPQKTQAFNLRDQVEERLDYLISIQSEKLIYA